MNIWGIQSGSLTSVEGHADAFFLAPNDVTRPPQPIARDAQGKPLGKPQGAVDFERRAGLGDVANRAGDRVSAELDRSGFEDAMTRCDTMLGHDQMIDVVGRDCALGRNPLSARERPRITGIKHKK